MLQIESDCMLADEVDALLGKRREQEHEAITTMKTEIMQLWDGFSTDDSAKIMILAATNRPYDLDDAVLRRYGTTVRPQGLTCLSHRHVETILAGVVAECVMVG